MKTAWAVVLGVMLTMLVSAPPLSAELYSVYVGLESDADDHPALMSEILVIGDQIAWEFPEARGVIIATEIMTMAYANVYALYDATTHRVVFNDLYTSNPDRIRAMVEDDVADGYHPPLGWCTAAQYLTFHEFAHVIDYQRGLLARKVVEQRFIAELIPAGELSEYSYTWDEGGRRVHPGEALAEAFAAVRCNGGTPTEQELNRILLES